MREVFKTIPVSFKSITKFEVAVQPVIVNVRVGTVASLVEKFQPMPAPVPLVLNPANSKPRISVIILGLIRTYNLVFDGKVLGQVIKRVSPVITAEVGLA